MIVGNYSLLLLSFIILVQSETFLLHDEKRHEHLDKYRISEPVQGEDC